MRPKQVDKGESHPVGSEVGRGPYQEGLVGLFHFRWFPLGPVWRTGGRESREETEWQEVLWGP